MRSFAVIVLLFFSCSINFVQGFVPLPPAATSRTSFEKSSFGQAIRVRNQKRDDSDKEDDPVDAFRAEQEAAQKVANRLMMPRVILTSISQTITALGWTFLIVSFILQALGYALVMDDTTGLRIDTLDAQIFQQEVTKSMKELK